LVPLLLFVRSHVPGRLGWSATACIHSYQVEVPSQDSSHSSGGRGVTPVGLEPASTASDAGRTTTEVVAPGVHL
jgi:hypothetical protein